MKWTLIIFTLGGDTESLGDYVTESLCYDAAEIELDNRQHDKWTGNGLWAEPQRQRGAWIAQCREVLGDG